MELQEILEKGVGTIERTILKPAKVKIVSCEIQSKRQDGSLMKTPLLKVRCKHPDRDELIDISKIKLLRDNKVQSVGLWVKLDEEQNIQKSSSVAHLLDFLNVKTLSEIYNKEVETVEESSDSSFLCLKAY